MAPTAVQLGSSSYQAAQPWASTANAGQLDPTSVLSRICFFHHRTNSTVHGDQPKVMRLLGATAQGEMMVSAYAKHLASCFGTIQPEPISVGAISATELVSFAGRTLPSVTPTTLKSLLGGSSNNPLVKLRQLRDSSLNELVALAKQDATGVQRQFLDEFANSQTQVRNLSASLSSLLSSISSDDIKGQALAAAALIAANVTPVVAIRVPFGGDNHSDNNLQAEAAQHVSGCTGIQQVISALSSNGLALTDKVTFATWNVFGRNLDGLSKVTQQQGRDHYGNHCVSLMIGKNVAPSVIGGVTLQSSALVASDIASASGAAVSGGDIAAADTHVAFARTLGVALGIPSSQISGDLIGAAGGKVVNAALSGVSG
jgi:hypothetical protein